MSHNFIVRKTKLYGNTREGMIFEYLCKYLVGDVMDMIIDYVTPFYGISKGNINIKIKNKICEMIVRDNEIIMGTWDGIVSIISLDGVLLRSFNRCFLLGATNNYLYLVDENRNLQIYNNKCEIVNSLYISFYTCRKYCHKNNLYLYIEYENLIKIYKRGIYVGKIKTLGVKHIKDILVDDMYIYFSFFGEDHFKLFDRKLAIKNGEINLSEIKKIDTGGFNIYSTKLCGPYLICGYHNYIMIYDIETRNRIKMIDLVELKIFNKMTKLININIFDNKLYILGDDSKIHIIK